MLTENDAVRPAVTTRLTGWLVIKGGAVVEVAGVVGVVERPVPERDTLRKLPVERVNVRVPLKACAAFGVNPTETVKLWDG